MNIDRILTELKDKGYRITNQRKAILEILSKANRPITAKKLQLKLGKKVDKATIYRNLEFLIANKLVNEYYFQDEFVRYELKDKPHHHHLICNKCRKILPIGANELEDVLAITEKEVAKKYGFTIHKHVLEFYGECTNCS